MLLFKLSLLLVLVSVLLQHVRSQEERKHVEMYVDPNYEGGFLWAGPPPDSLGCHKFKDHSKIGSLQTNTCIVIFSTNDCIGRPKNPSFVLNPGEYPDMSDVSHHGGYTANRIIGSLRECGEYEGDQSWAIKFLNKYKEEWLEYYGIQGCYNLPVNIYSVYGIRSGNCFNLHDSNNCWGRNVTLQGGNSSAHWDLGIINFEGKAKSISTC